MASTIDLVSAAPAARASPSTTPSLRRRSSASPNALAIRLVASLSNPSDMHPSCLGTRWPFHHLIKTARNLALPTWHDTLIRKLEEHSRLTAADIAGIRRLPDTRRSLRPHEDIVRQGDRPSVSVVVLEGTLARYHTLRGGGRQYLSLHIAGDMPDAHALFLERLDHAICAMGDAVVALVPHTALLNLFHARPASAFAFWRETLIDAAIFREAITNNCARPLQTRLAHFFCEQYYRARVA